jgi:soluble lytic murein transglycosylase
MTFAVIAVALFFVIKNLGGADKLFGKTMYPIKYSEYVDKASEDYNLDRALIYAVIHTESHFDEDAESAAGAKGLMQLMPESFEWIQSLKGESLDSDSIMEPKVNIDYGSYLLKYFLDRYGDKNAAIAAYNAGFVVSDWLENSEYSSDGKTLDIIPYPETEKYVEKVLKAEEMYNKLYFS